MVATPSDGAGISFSKPNDDGATGDPDTFATMDVYEFLVHPVV